MNAGLVTSFVVAGIMILSIIAFNQSVYNSSSEATLTTMNQTRIDNLVEVITNDFNRAGFNTGISNNFNHIYSQDVEFVGDIYDNDTFGATTVRWYLDSSDSVTTTSNPDDVYLKRVGPVSNGNITTLSYPVTYFEIRYFAGDGSVTSNPDNVRRIQIEIIMEAGEYHSATSDGEKQYHRTVWKRTFVPNNINF